MEYTVTLLIHADDDREASKTAEAIADSAEATIVSINLAPDA